MSKSKFIHTLSESKNTFALQQQAIAVSFVKNVAFLLAYLVVLELSTIIHKQLVAMLREHLTLSILLTPGNDRGVTPHSIDQSSQVCSRALRSKHERVHDFHSKQFSCRQPFKLNT